MRGGRVAGLLSVLVIAWLVFGSGGWLPEAVDYQSTRTPDAIRNTTAGQDVAFAFRGLHAQGATGKGVRVGIVDPTGFDTDEPTLTGRIVATQSFGEGNTIANGGRNRHGTAAAEVVGTTAPDSDLYLANFDTVTGYQQAIAWLVDRNVDVIVLPFSFYGKRGNGMSSVSQTAEWAAERGIVVVAPTGNLARRHWAGEYDLRPNRTHMFRNGRIHNHLTPVTNGSKLVLWLSWDRAHRAQDYDLVVYRHTNGTTTRVATSQPVPADSVPNERLVVDVGPGRYSFVIEGPDTDTDARLAVTSPTHRLAIKTPAGSITAPASADDVLAVGAYNATGNRVARYSSRGPTPAGRIGVDIVAPGAVWEASGTRFVGSSASAAYVGGVIADLLSEDPTLTPTQVRETLWYSARDVGPPGFDTWSGRGLIDPVAALNRLTR